VSAARTPPERAARLVRWYPRAWRERYAEEFAELLIADMEERPRSAVRALDVARAGLAARIATTGIAESPLLTDPRRRVRASLAALWAALALCLALSAAMWSQLAIAWRWAPVTQGPVQTVGMSATLMTSASAAVLAFLTLVVLAVIPVCHAVARDFGRRLAVPALVLTAAVTVLAVGGHHFIYQWPGTGGRGGAGSLFPFIPAGLLANARSLTYWFSSTWGHWSFLSGLSPQDLAWMAASPVAFAAAVAAAVSLVRRAELPPRLLAYETRIATVACAIMGVFLVGCGFWVYAGRPPGRAHAGQADAAAGLIDVAATAVLALALAAACQARRTAQRTLRLVRR
jgi:hypothetical protein